jgi:hypothetical protein
MSESKPSKHFPERRLMIRYASNAGAEVVRDSDRMRCGIEGRLRDVSIGGLGIHMQSRLEVGEFIKAVLRNDIQRVEKEARGVVRHTTPREDGTYYVGVELLNRLTPLEVSLLRMGIRSEDAAEEAPKWV